jgi:hypothetical protein
MSSIYQEDTPSALDRIGYPACTTIDELEFQCRKWITAIKLLCFYLSHDFLLCMSMGCIDSYSLSNERVPEG